MLRTLLSVWLLAAVANSYRSWKAGPLVFTREGPVRGEWARSAAGNTFYSFKGIPYAEAPVGPLRFKPPRRLPERSWSEVWDATAHGDVCLQLDTNEENPLLGNEDCLNVNVYTRQLPARRRAAGGLPVMVYIHGGMYLRGSGNDQHYGPSYFMDEDIVLVTFNYRLGVFGFFTTYDSSAPGNYGLLDQVMLLQWVQDNIARFGGDPNAVTIFGESAGGACVSILVLSPLTKGLFHHAISQSGTALANFGASGRQMGFPTELGEKLDCPSGDTEKMVECMRAVPAEDLLMTASPLEHLFQPRVDAENKSPVLPENPRYLLERGDFNLVPWMHGTTKEEGWPFVPVLASNEFILAALLAGNNMAWSMVSDLNTRSESSILECNVDPNEEAIKVRQFYTGENTTEIKSLLPIAQVISDRFFNAAMLAETSLASRHTPVYRYVFDYNAPDRLSWTNLSELNVGDTDAMHGDDVVYLFSQSELPLAPPGSPNHRLIRLMVSMWTSFARTGRPSSHAGSAPDWPIVTEQSQRHMRLSLEPTVGERLFEERYNFWKTIRIDEPWREPPAVQVCLFARFGGEGDEGDELGQAFYSSMMFKSF